MSDPRFTILRRNPANSREWAELRSFPNLRSAMDELKRMVATGRHRLADLSIVDRSA